MQLSLGTIVAFVAIVGAQIQGSSMLPRTDGFRNLGWTAFCLTSYLVSFVLMAQLISRGTALSLLIPAMTAVIPIVLIFVGVFAYGESASTLKVCLLVFSCGLIAFAGSIA